MDALGDTQIAMDEYSAGRLTADSHGALYLAVYGILQILYVQQDAARDLASALGIGLELPPEIQGIL